MEFTNRLYSEKHRISTLERSPIGGVVRVLGVERDGTIKSYPKHRDQVKTL
jgi:hypothetical protein